MNFAVIDLETVNNSATSIATIGIVGVDKGKIVETAEYHVKPDPFFFDEKATSVNGLKESNFVNAPSFPEIWNDLSAWFTRYDFFVAHNASFDFGLLRACCDEYNLDYKDILIADSLSYARNSEIEFPDHKLDTLCKHLNVCLEQHHTALCDAIATANVMLNLIALNNDNILDLLHKSNAKTLSFYKERTTVGIQKSKTKKEQQHNWGISAKTAVAADIDFKKSNVFHGAKVVISGNLASMTRSAAYSLLKACGAEVCDNLTLSTNYLITNAEETTGKIKKAMEYIQRGKDIKIIDESQFLKILEENNESKSNKYV